MDLLNLAPHIQEAILFLPRTVHGRDAMTERELRPIVERLDWEQQRTAFMSHIHVGGPAQPDDPAIMMQNLGGRSHAQRIPQTDNLR